MSFHLGLHKRYDCLQSSITYVSSRFWRNQSCRVFRFYCKIYFFLNNQIIVSVNKINFDYNCTFVFQWCENMMFVSSISNLVSYACYLTDCGQRTKKQVYNIRCADFILLIFYETFQDSLF